MEKNGYIIIRDAVKYPSLKLRRLEKDNRVHSKIMWQLRFEVKKYYEELWNTNDLVSCFGGNLIDNDSFNLPWHVDQNNSRKKNIHSYQGILALTPSNSTHLLVKSHKYFDSMANRCTNKNKYEWESYEIPDSDYIWKKGLKIKIPELNAGDLLIFDSRIIHKVLSINKRSVVYISMEPRNNLSNLVERLRKKAYKENFSTTHWCSKLIKRDKDYPWQELNYNRLV